MALITTRTKLTRLLSYGSRSSGGIRVGSLGKFGAMCWSTAVAPVESGPEGFGMMGLKDYEDYRRSLYGEITHKALLVDAAGTLLVPSQPMAQVSLGLSPTSHPNTCTETCMHVLNVYANVFVHV